MRITRVTLQNIQTAHTAQYQNTNTNLKMGGSPDKTFFQINHFPFSLLKGTQKEAEHH